MAAPLREYHEAWVELAPPVAPERWERTECGPAPAESYADIMVLAYGPLTSAGVRALGSAVERRLKGEFSQTVLKLTTYVGPGGMVELYRSRTPTRFILTGYWT